MAISPTIEQCPACGGTGSWERKAQVSPCNQALCLYLASKDGVTLDELAQWVIDLGGQSTAYAYGFLVDAAAKGLLEIGRAESLQADKRPVWLTKFGQQVASDTIR
ncbi:MAG: hypothetical protein ACRDYA_13540 [Egibacteraceae bacterium]